MRTAKSHIPPSLFLSRKAVVSMVFSSSLLDNLQDMRIVKESQFDKFSIVQRINFSFLCAVGKSNADNIGILTGTVRQRHDSFGSSSLFSSSRKKCNGLNIATYNLHKS